VADQTNEQWTVVSAMVLLKWSSTLITISTPSIPMASRLPCRGSRLWVIV